MQSSLNPGTASGINVFMFIKKLVDCTII